MLCLIDCVGRSQKRRGRGLGRGYEEKLIAEASYNPLFTLLAHHPPPACPAFNFLTSPLKSVFEVISQTHLN